MLFRSFVELTIERMLLGARGIVRDHRLCPGAGDGVAEMIGVVCGISEHGSGSVIGKQGGGLWHVAAMAGGQDKTSRTAQTPHGQVDLGAQPTSRTADGLIRSPFFAPAAC